MWIDIISNNLSISLAKTYFHLSFAQKLQKLFSGKKKLWNVWGGLGSMHLYLFRPKFSKQQYKNNSSSCIVLKYA